MRRFDIEGGETGLEGLQEKYFDNSLDRWFVRSISWKTVLVNISYIFPRRKLFFFDDDIILQVVTREVFMPIGFKDRSRLTFSNKFKVMTGLEAHDLMIGDAIQDKRDDPHERESPWSDDAPDFFDSVFPRYIDKDLRDNLKIIPGFRNNLGFDNCPFLCIDDMQSDVLPYGIDEEGDHRGLISAVGKCFKDMPDFDIWRSIDVCDSTGNPEDTVVDTCRQLELLCRYDGDLHGFIRDMRELLDVYIRHFCIRMQVFSRKSFFLECFRLPHRLPEACARDVRLLLAKFANLHTGDLDEYIDTIKNRARET